MMVLGTVVLSLGGLAALGISARWNWWRPEKGGLPILMYHKIGDPPAGSKLKKLWVSVELFRRQMTYLKEKGWNPLHFIELDSLLDRGEPLPEKAVIISFDDGYLNNYENAFPVLKEFGFPAVIFLVVNAVGKDNFWHDPSSETRIPMMSWEQVEEMQAAGIEFGAHTMNHPRLASIDPQKAKEEIVDSRRALTERLGREPASFAYPYGNGQDVFPIQKLVHEAKFRWACSIHQGKADLRGQTYCLRRIFVRGDDNMWDFHLNMTRGKSRF